MAVANSATQRLVDWLWYALLLLCAAVTLMPFLYLVCSAVKTRATFFLVACFCRLAMASWASIGVGLPWNIFMCCLLIRVWVLGVRW